MYVCTSVLTYRKLGMQILLIFNSSCNSLFDSYITAWLTVLLYCKLLMLLTRLQLLYKHFHESDSQTPVKNMPTVVSQKCS